MTLGGDAGVEHLHDRRIPRLVDARLLEILGQQHHHDLVDLHVARQPGQLDRQHGNPGERHREVPLHRAFPEQREVPVHLLDPAVEPAKVRAMFVRDDWTRHGLGRRILEECKAAARREGFRRLALMATLPGTPGS